MAKKGATYSAKSDRHAEHKHLFGSGGKSDFIINMTAQGAQKLCGVYSIIAILLVALSSIPYYIAKAVESGDEYNMLNSADGQTLAFLIMTLLVAAGFIGMLVFMVACVKKEVAVGKNKALWLFAGVLISALISTLAADDIGTAFFGYLDRAEGFITIIGYIGFFAVGMTLTNAIYRRRAANTVVVIGSANALMGILQSIPALAKWIPSYYNYLFIDYINNVSKAEYFNRYAGYDASYAADGFTCSPFALGALLTIAFALALNNAAYGKFIGRVLNTAACALMAGAAIATQTFPAMLGIAVVLLTAFILAIIGAVKEKQADTESEGGEKFGKAPVLMVLLCGVISAAIFGGIFATDNFRMRNEHIMYTDSFERLGIAYGAHSAHEDGIYPTLWYEGALTFENSPIIGVGPDNWATMWNSGEGMEIDRTYNEYLDTAVTRGVLGLAFYAAVIIVTLIKAARIFRRTFGKADKLAAGLFTAFLAYAVQAFFNISALCSTPFFYLVIGIIWSYDAKGRPLDEIKKGSEK